jgi:uncharacterized protein (TIGR02996 family)
MWSAPVSDLFALLSAVERDPTDPLARGVLADWLDDHADPRGPLVRTSHELILLGDALAELDALAERPIPPAHLLPEPPHPLNEFERLVWAAEEFCSTLGAQRNDLEAQLPVLNERLGRHYDEWLQLLRPEFASLGYNYETFCGVVDTVHAPVSLWRRIRPEVMAPHPIRSLYLRAEFGTDPRVAPDTHVPLPHLRTLGVSARQPRGAFHVPVRTSLPPSADLDYVRDCAWLGSAEELLLYLGSGDRNHLLAWAARELPESRSLRLSRVRLDGRSAYRLNLPVERVTEFCLSALLDRLTELDLGTALAQFSSEDVARILRLPFGTVRTLVADFQPWSEGGLPPGEDITPDLRAVLIRAEANWAQRGRKFRWRVVPYGEFVPSVAEQVLRVYWSATDTTWAPPDPDHDDEWYDSGSADDDVDWGLAPTRRELYRGRFRNPRRD